MESLDLSELNAKSAGIGGWVVQVHGMRHVHYEYQWQGKPQKGQKLECLLVTSDGNYCQGVVRTLPPRAGGEDPGSELKKVLQKFTSGSVWRMTKVALAKEKKEYMGSPCKVCIDIRKTRTDPVLRGAVKMPPAPAPEEDLKTIVSLPSSQRVDITALVQNMSDVRNEVTAYGRKQIVDITIVDGSKDRLGEGQVGVTFTMFIDTGATGTASLQSMRNAATSKTPLSIYGLTCIPRAEGKCEFKCSQGFFWEPAQGTYAKLLRLQSQADELLGAASTSITAEWVPSATRDFAAEDATYTVCGCIAALLNPSPGAACLSDELPGTDVLFQINHCHVASPCAEEQVLTNDGTRIWLQNVRIMDATGSVTVAVREKAALALSKCESADAFQDAHGTNDISFPVLSSVRVHLAKRKVQEGGAQEPTSVRPVMVEAEEQDMRCMPNKSLLAMTPILKGMSASTEELKVARLSEISALPHVGMVVDGQKCELALVLAGATEKSEFAKFGIGYRLTTKNMLDIGFGSTGLSQSDCLAGAKSDFDLVTICNEHNLTDYKMAPPRRGGGVQYVLLVISGVRETPATGAAEPRRKTFMVERIQLTEAADFEHCQQMLTKLSHARSEFIFEGTKRDQSAWADEAATPVSSAKKARRLSAAPTDASL